MANLSLSIRVENLDKVREALGKLSGAQAKQAISNAVFIIAINLFIGLTPGIDNWGHVGGLLGGSKRR